MKRVIGLFLILTVLALLVACKQPGEPIDEPSEPTETVSEDYIWTVSIDELSTQDHGEGNSATYRVHLSASKEGGADPLGDYRGELRVEYAFNPSGDAQAALAIIGAPLDGEGWGEKDDLTFTMEPFDIAPLQQFVASAHQGEEPALAPLLEGIAMYTADDVPWTDSDWNMGMSGGIEGLFGIDVSGSENGGQGDLFSVFGNQSVSGSERVPLRYSIHFLDENRVRLDIWSFGPIDVNLSFNGTLDKIPLSETISP